MVRKGQLGGPAIVTLAEGGIAVVEIKLAVDLAAAPS